MIDKTYVFDELPKEKLDKIQSAIWIAKWLSGKYGTNRHDFIYDTLEELFYEMYSNNEINNSEPDYLDFAKYFFKKLDVWKDGYVEDKYEINEHIYLKCCLSIYNNLIKLGNNLSSTKKGECNA